MAIVVAVGLMLFATQTIPNDTLDWPWPTMAPSDVSEPVDKAPRRATPDATDAGHDHVFAFFVGNPIYYRSTLDLQRPDGTDLSLRGLGWDGDALHFPIDGGVRYMRWHGQTGVMIEHLHNKAVARLGRGAHGRKLRYPVVEEVAAYGTLKGRPVDGRVKLTDIFDRLEFTHGHNMLFLAGLFKLASPLANVRPYIGLGGGVAFPHTEVRFKGEARSEQTYEYQYSGPALQLVAGLELKSGKVSYFLEYKFSMAWIHGALTGQRSWRNWDVFGDLWRQFQRWSRGETAKHGAFQTRLSAHQILVGVGYRHTAAAPRTEPPH